MLNMPLDDCKCRKQRPSDTERHTCHPTWVELAETVPGEIVTLDISPDQRGYGLNGATVTVDVVSDYGVYVIGPDGWRSFLSGNVMCSID